MNQFDNFCNRLKQQFALGLPGTEAHLRLAPETRIKGLKNPTLPEGATESAVLILLYPVENSVKTVLILRNEYNGAHSGQISLPGGKAEPSDLSPELTCLRETFEETGVDPGLIEIIGRLSEFYVPPSHFIIHPFVGITPVRPEFKPDPTEVQRLIEIDLLEDLDFGKLEKKSFSYLNNTLVFEAPGWYVGGEFLWGATAMIMSELLMITARQTAG